MGRKPNALILQHFTRGAKLNDSSNRYEHTCKSCGERFPKGRIDSLTTHLIKKCPRISTPDRRKALLELNNIPDHADSTRARGGQGQMNGPAAMDWARTEDTNNANSDFSGLHALVEATQFDILQKHDDRSINNGAGHGSSASEPARLDIQELYTSDNPPVSYEQRAQRDKKVLRNSVRRESEASLQPATFVYHTSGSREASPSLAISASNMAAVATAAARYIPPMVDPQLFRDDVNDNQPDAMTSKVEQEPYAPTNPEPSYFQNSTEHETNLVMIDSLPTSHLYPFEPDHSEHGYESQEIATHTRGPVPLLMQQPMNMIAEYGNGRKAAKPKVRGRFPNERRKEVQKIRKIGACLRCRMLKKPCGEGTPCATCINVSSARVWVLPCTRVNIGEALEMYTAGLHAILSHAAVSDARDRCQFRNTPHLIDASHFPDTNIFATLTAVHGLEISPEDIVDPGLTGGNSTNIRRLFEDDLQSKLANYAENMLTTFISREPSHFISVTLDTALQRSGQNEALIQALQLWVIVHILVDSSRGWVLSERDSELAPVGKGNIIDKSAGDHAYEDLCGQLNAAAEKQAGTMFNKVLKDFETRLIGRAKTQRFDFFLIALIILSCVEKTMWLFKSWGQAEFQARYPLPKSTHEYLDQGEHLASMVHMMLQVRNMVPKTYAKPDGILATADGDQALEQWLDRVQLTAMDVTIPRDLFEPDNCRCFELRLIARLLTPTA
ncbi:hypothetical protein N431DRAFT_390669 [Stipitochalara longipes BDJ]|nr:hypothetical protein N431DRAFT_390669 [Stipitochalara longipes BDJ]